MQALDGEIAADVVKLQPVEDTATTVPGMPIEDQQGSSDKSLEKRKAKEKKRLASEFTKAMTGSIQCLEDALDHGTPAQRQLTRQRRRMLKDVLKAATEPSASVDERLRYLQSKFVQLVNEQTQQDRELLTLQARLDTAEKRSGQGQADLQRANQKLDRLQQLARTMQRENKRLTEEVELRKGQLDSFRSATQAIQEKIESHSTESIKVMQDNQQLVEENHNLRSKLENMANMLTDTQERLESLRTAQAQQLQAIQDKLGQQSDFIERSQELQGHMSGVLQENKLLTEQLQALDMHNKQLESLNAEYKKQLDNCRTQLKGMESSLAASSKLMKFVEKLQQDMAVHQKQALLLQQQVKEQADELKRSQLQKLRLEGLCRALQARLGGAAAVVKGNPTASPQLDRNHEQAVVTADSADDDDTAAICCRTVQAAISAIMARYC